MMNYLPDGVFIVELKWYDSDVDVLHHFVCVDSCVYLQDTGR